MNLLQRRYYCTVTVTPPRVGMDIQRYSFRLSFYNELAAVDESFQVRHALPKRLPTFPVQCRVCSSSTTCAAMGGTRLKYAMTIIAAAFGYATHFLPRSQINDVKHKKKFLSRVHYPPLKLADIVVDGKVTMCVMAGFWSSFRCPAMTLPPPQIWPPVPCCGVRGRLYKKSPRARKRALLRPRLCCRHPRGCPR